MNEITKAILAGSCLVFDRREDAAGPVVNPEHRDDAYEYASDSVPGGLIPRRDFRFAIGRLIVIAPGRLRHRGKTVIPGNGCRPRASICVIWSREDATITSVEKAGK